MKWIATLILTLFSYLCQAQDTQNEIATLQDKINQFVKVGDTLSVDYTISLDDLGEFYYGNKKYSEAEKIFLKSLKLKKEILGEKHIEYAYSSHNLGSFYGERGRYLEAEPLLLKALEIRLTILGKKNKMYLKTLENIAIIYAKQEKYSQAEPFFLEVIEIKKSIFGETNPEYISSLRKLAFFNQAKNNSNDITALQNKKNQIEKSGDFLSQEYITTLNNLGELFIIQKKYSEAEALFEKSLEINKNTLGEKHKNYIFSLNNLGELFIIQKKYSEAEALFQKSLEINKNTLGEKHKDYIFSLCNLAILNEKQGKYNEAETLFIKALEIGKETFGEKKLDYAKLLNELASLYEDKGDYQKAEPLYLESLEIYKNELGKNDIKYPTIINNLGYLYFEKGDYQKAESLYLESLKYFKNILGENNPDYSANLNNLGLLYHTLGDNKKAESLYLQSLEIIQNVPNESEHYAEALGNLAGIYVEQGNYLNAEKLYLQSLEIRKEVLGENHLKYAQSLVNLADLYNYGKAYEKAEPLYFKSLEIYKKRLGESHPDYATLLNNLAVLYMNQRSYQKAESLYLKSLEIYKTTFGENNSHYATLLNNLAGSYVTQGNFKKAEPLYLRSLEIRKKVLGENHPLYSQSIDILSYFYQNTKPENKEKATLFLDLSSLKFQNSIKLSSTYMSEKEFDFFRIKNFENRFSSLSFLYRNAEEYEKINIDSYENELLIKNLSLRKHQSLINSIQRSGNTKIKEIYEKFVDNKKLINKWNELSTEKWPSNYEQVNSETETLEKELARKSALFADYKNILSSKWKKIQNKLKPNEVAIDLVAFKYYNKKWTDSIIYSAFLVGQNYKVPKFIPLFEEKQLDFLLSRNKTQLDSTRINKQYLDKGISDLFLKPLEKELEGITTIYFSPSGLGHQIDFTALPINETQTLGQKYKVHILSSPAELMDYKVDTLDKKSKIELLLYGGIDYTKSIVNTSLNIIDNSITTNEDFINATNRSGIETLPGTLKEVDGISANAKKGGFISKVFKESDATEESIKALDGSTTPYVLHLATHGFFFPDPIQEIPKDILSSGGKSKIYKNSDDPMMRSGLLLAGAKNYWGKSNPNNTIENGILTASEISNLDLSACQLVVLSACETGLGEVKGSEGVFGLQRAFKMAGVKNIIMSLWKVPDTQTAELFDIFYSECFAGKSIHEAFQSAQTKMKAKYSPYYWAGFVLLE